MRLVLLILLFSGDLLAKRATINMPFPGGVERVEFDDAKISQTDMRRILRQLDPFLSGFSGYSIPNSLELCVNADAKYWSCESRDIRAANFLHNAEVNIQISAHRLNELEESAFPEELKPVRDYITSFLGSGLRVQQCRLQYYKNWNAAILKTCDATEKAETCDEIVEKLETEKDRMAKYSLTKFEWPNCVLQSQRTQLGEYPQDNWNKFLRAYGITEQEITNDD